MRHKKRTKKRYLELFDNPSSLFGTAETIIFPNGINEIWVKDKNGRKGFSIEASEGPAGFSIRIKPFIGTDTAICMAYDKQWNGTYIEPCNEVTLMQYHTDEKSQAYKDWYIADSEDIATRKALAQRLRDLGDKNFQG